jgi:iron-sulfur cluster assembly protein
MNPTSPAPTSPAPKEPMKAKRPRPQVMRLTDAAATRVAELTKRADSEIVGLRVGVKNGGCAGHYKADKMQAQFIFNNPNQIGACGCGESVQLKPAEIDG